jgi:hypothetical protein
MTSSVESAGEKISCPPRETSTVFAMFFFNAQVDDCEAFEVAMVEPASVGTRNLKVLRNGKFDTRLAGVAMPFKC